MLGALFEQRAIRDPGWNAWANGDDFPRGTTVTEESSLRLLAVYSCVRVISDAVATLPVDVYRSRGGVREEVSKPAWVEKPSIDLDRISFLTQQMVSLLLRGNSYALVLRNAVGMVVELVALHPDVVRVTKDNRGRTRYFVAGTEVDRSRILHVPALMVPGSPVGLDPVTFAADAIGLGLNAQTYGSAFFSQGAVPSGLIKAPGDMTGDEAKRLRDQWLTMHGGPKKGNLPAVLTGGADYLPITISNEQSQFLETRKYTDEQIYRLFGLGSPLSGDNGPSITYANVEQRATDVTRYTLMPWLARLELAWSSLLPRPQYVKFNLDAFQRADTNTRYQGYKTGLDAQFLTRDEVRALEDLPPLPDVPGTQDTTQ